MYLLDMYQTHVPEPPPGQSLDSAAVATVVSVRGPRKRYGALEALKGSDFDLRAGEVFGLLGPNGAGTTTTIEILERYLGRALSGGPALSCLGEPTTGFDPAARRRAWETIRTLSRLGKTILLTTHYLDEVEQLADRVAVLREGRIVASGTPQELTSS